MKFTQLATTALAATLGISGEASAVTQIRSDRQTAVTNCQAFLPSSEGGLRRRALGIGNEGGVTVFINCGFTTESFFSTGASQVLVFLTNKGAAEAAVSCTLVSGPGSAFGPTTFFPRTFVLGAGSATFRGWTSVSDNGGIRISEPSISCAIPPNVEINATSVDYSANVGL